jgi:hypothetical protein
LRHFSNRSTSIEVLTRRSRRHRRSPIGGCTHLSGWATCFARNWVPPRMMWGGVRLTIRSPGCTIDR